MAETSDAQQPESCFLCTEQCDNFSRVFRFLWCGHGFCSICLLKLRVNDTITCGLCKGVSTIPNGDLETLLIKFLPSKKCNTVKICTYEACEDGIHEAAFHCVTCKQV